MWFSLLECSQRIPASHRCGGLGFIDLHVVFENDPALVNSEFATPPDLVFDRRRALQVRRESRVNCAAYDRHTHTEILPRSFLRHDRLFHWRFALEEFVNH